MSDDDPRRMDAPGGGSDFDDLHRAGEVGEGPPREAGEPGVEVGRDSGQEAARAEGTEHAGDEVVKNQRSRKGWIIGGSAAAGLVLVALIAVIAVNASAGSRMDAASIPSIRAVAKVPDLAGMTVADARKELDGIGLTLSVPDGTDDEAIVAAQWPAEGREVAVGTDVTVTVEETTEADTESLGFAEGADLDPLAWVGWQFSLGGDDAAWTSSPDAGSGEVIFAHSDGTCTAQYWQQTFDPTAADDLAATNEFLAEISGASAEEMAQYAFDWHFALSGGVDGPPREGEVATRTLLWDDGENDFLLTVRVFHKLDYATSTMSNAYIMRMMCDLGVAPQDFIDSLDEIAKISVSS